jgi:hypothetical protein
MTSPKLLRIAGQARLLNRRVRLGTRTAAGCESFTGYVITIADEVGGRGSTKIVLDAGARQVIVGLSTVTSIEMLPR